jgi:peptidoglycan hydrolase-like protein with peptidoglycan-binding domain
MAHAISSTRRSYQAFQGALTESRGLHIGHKGPQVLEMQKMLRRAGFDTGPLDGKFGPITQRAVKAFQKAMGAKADGSMEKSQLTKLGSMPPSQASTFNTPAQTPNINGEPNISVQTSGAQGPGTAAEMLRRALEQKGDRYVFGAEVNLDDKNPNTFDCSELVQWAVHQAGGTIPDGSQNQRAYVRQHGKKLSVAEASRIPGALLFNGHHVAISVGDGVHTIEAMGSNYGVRIGTIGSRFEDGGLAPGLRY